MAIVLPGDLDVFFDADGFGEAIVYQRAGAAPVAAVAQWERGDARPRFNDMPVAFGTNHFTVRHDIVGEPLAGAEIVITATGETFVVDGVAEQSTDGMTWRCAAIVA